KVEPLQKPYIHLVLSIPRFATFESVLEKAVELGVHTVRPVVSDFSFIRETKELKSTRVERWQKIIRAGTQQSGRGELLELSPVSTLQE
ncbi:RsmE family RNA methyltransferase, partial [Shewanella algae]|uniref:RsmE family RNA methyltransferase n=1 Tax=Shewanella algae TaxID=38313 RepID=UPI00313E0373